MTSNEIEIPNASTAQWRFLNIQESFEILQKLSKK